MPLKILLVDQDAVALAFALRCVKAGHAVRWFIKPDKSNNQRTGDGFKGIQKISNWLSSVKWADLIWCANNSDYIPKLDSLRKEGVNYFGPSKMSADLEIKRAEGMKFLEKNKIEVPSFKQFASLAEAEAHVRKTEERFVFKTLGDNEDKSLSYVSKDPADMIARLQRWQKLNMNPKGPVMLQEFIEGIEFAVSGWMGKKGFVGLPNENFEHKKLLSGNAGPNCGETGTIMKYVNGSALAESVLFPLEKALVKMGHMGDIDVNCIIDKKGKAWPLEFTMRPGWPAFNIMLAEHKGDPAQWMLDACQGKDTLDVSPQVACGIVLGIPDFPFSRTDMEEREGTPIYGVTEKNKQFIAPEGVKMEKLPQMEGKKVVEKEMWVSTDNCLGVVTGLGKTVKQACERAYATVKELSASDMMWRDDIGESLEKSLPELQKNGYAKEFTYE